MDNTNELKRLEELLNNAPNSYPGFSKMIVFSCGRSPENCQKPASFVEKNPAAPAVEITKAHTDEKAVI